MNYTVEDLTCQSCVYYESKYGCDNEEKKCILSDSANFMFSFPCSHYEELVKGQIKEISNTIKEKIEDAKHYKDRTEIKKPVKVKKLKERKNIRRIE